MAGIYTSKNFDTSALLDKIYYTRDILLVVITIVTTAFLVVSLVTFVSTIANTAREAQAYNLPIMLLASFSGMSLMMQAEGSSSWFTYIIPIYNSTLCFRDILSLNLCGNYVVITFTVNLILAGVLCVLASALLKKEYIVFPR